MFASSPAPRIHTTLLLKSHSLILNASATMSYPQYCKPCQRLFSGKAQPRQSDKESFIHHPDAESFKESLRLPCVLCSRAWGSHFAERDIPSVIWGRFSFPDDDNDPEDGIREFDFGYGNSKSVERSETMALVPWQDMHDHQFPPFLSHRTDSPSALNFLVSQYRKCTESHNGCRRRQQSSSSFEPARLIDIGEFESNNIRICDTQNLVKRGSYICLSYCWGKTQPLMLTKRTEHILRNGVSVSTLVKTFRDAILITRLLGIRYLWIDSLCIFQDDISEWEFEASRMGHIYSHAVCTIAATSAKDSEGGLFFDRNPVLLQPLCVEFTGSDGPSVDTFDVEVLNTLLYPLAGRYWCEVLSTWSKAVENGPLNSRAWVAQERHLSPRIMHFTDTQLFWECHECMASENYQKGLPHWALPFWTRDPTSLKRYVHQIKSFENPLPLKTAQDIVEDLPLYTNRDIYHEWRSFRIHYSICKMTEEDDKLVAIQGIAQNVGSILGDNLVAGLWRNRFLEDLCWFKHPLKDDPIPNEPIKWRAPTWSWASSNERIWVSNTSKWHKSCPDLQIWAEVYNLDIKSHTSGKLAHASVRIRCRPLPASISLDESGGHRYSVYGILRFTESAVEIRAESSSGTLDLVLDPPGYTGVHNVHIFIIQRCAHESIPDDSYGQENVVEGLLIVPESACDGVFKRLGVFEAKGDVNVNKIVQEHEAAEEKVITMI